MLKTESNKGHIAPLETERKDGTENLLEAILERNNLNRAYRKVKRNGCAVGIDGMTVDEMLPYLKEHRKNFLNARRNGIYEQKMVVRIEVPNLPL